MEVSGFMATKYCMDNQLYAGIPYCASENSYPVRQLIGQVSEASLKHTLNAVAGLFVLLLFYYREEGQNGQLNPDPVIFRAGAPFHVDRLMWGPGANVYQLQPDDNG